MNKIKEWTDTELFPNDLERSNYIGKHKMKKKEMSVIFKLIQCNLKNPKVV